MGLGLGLGPGERSVILNSFTVIREREVWWCRDGRDNELIMIQTAIIVSKVTERRLETGHNTIEFRMSTLPVEAQEVGKLVWSGELSC